MPRDGGSMSNIRPPTGCELFKPGHAPHYIQIRKAAEDRDHVAVKGRFIGSLTDTSVEVEVEGAAFPLWNHECERLAAAAALANGAIEYQPQWGLLWVPSTNGRYAFCVARVNGGSVPCSDRTSIGGPSELLRSAGGFIVRLTSATPADTIVDEGLSSN
jgi:hypothetical protein